MLPAGPAMICQQSLHMSNFTDAFNTDISDQWITLKKQEFCFGGSSAYLITDNENVLLGFGSEALGDRNLMYENLYNLFELHICVKSFVPKHFQD